MHVRAQKKALQYEARGEFSNFVLQLGKKQDTKIRVVHSKREHIICSQVLKVFDIITQFNIDFQSH